MELFLGDATLNHFEKLPAVHHTGCLRMGLGMRVRLRSFVKFSCLLSGKTRWAHVSKRVVAVGSRQTIRRCSLLMLLLLRLAVRSVLFWSKSFKQVRVGVVSVKNWRSRLVHFNCMGNVTSVQS